MSALTIDLMGNTPLDEATIQARAQDIIASQWAPWKRERALRLAAAGDTVQLDALNAYMAEISAEVDLSRGNSALLLQVLQVESAQRVIALPDMDAYDLAAIKVEAQSVIDAASPQVLALVASRVPVPEPEPEPLNVVG